MEKIESFKINHLLLKRGIYVSRKDTTYSGDIITTFDIRLSEPNRMPPIDGAILHTIEHIAATFLRNHPFWGKNILYFGPMGCHTGCYLLMLGEFSSMQILPLIVDLFNHIANYDSEEIPGATPIECGNYSYNDLEGAKSLAETFHDEVLIDIAYDSLNYPQ